MVKHLATGHYVLVWGGLVALTAISWGVSYADLGALELAVALAIATAKSVLVLLFFMHLIEERFTSVMVPVVAAGLISILVGLMVLDVMTRETFPRAPDPGVVMPGLHPE